MNFISTFPCFVPKEVKAINALIKKNLGQKEDTSQIAKNVNKTGKFFNFIKILIMITYLNC